MCNHAEKSCPRCADFFDCRAANIAACSCTAIVMTDEEREWIRLRYDDCLCTKCLLELKDKTMRFGEQFLSK